MNTLKIAHSAAYPFVKLDVFEWILKKSISIKFFFSKWLLNRILALGTLFLKRQIVLYNGFYERTKAKKVTPTTELFLIISDFNGITTDFYQKIEKLPLVSHYQKDFRDTVKELAVVSAIFENYLIAESFEDDKPFNLKVNNTTFAKDWNSKEDEIWDTL